ncbi:MAG: YggS family pyridoxal phosphate-dependent enzyme [Bacteriovoracaceae bacterium]|jgi:PLP dependent protein|nr:YggS family pyridoxal phosphate-dependent enzyme [Bacteriovoracaceae bacterium]
MDRVSYITEKINLIKKRIGATKLVAVTKYATIEDAKTIYYCDHYDLGEARVSQLQERSQEFYASSMDKIRWHFIGNLQTNKINRLLKIPNLYAIHSIDSKKLLEGIYDRIDLFEGYQLRFYVQIKTSEEHEKSGVENYDQLSQIVNYILAHPHAKLKFQGLMTMGAIRTENFKVDAVTSFKKLAKIRNKLLKDYDLNQDFELSMGMSNDYQLAIDSGSHLVRIGQALFPEKE